MKVKMNQHTSQSYDLVGGAPQGSLLGQLLYIIGIIGFYDTVFLFFNVLKIQLIMMTIRTNIEDMTLVKVAITL